MKSVKGDTCNSFNAQIFALPVITCPKLFDFMSVNEEEDGSFSSVLVDIWTICDILWSLTEGIEGRGGIITTLYSFNVF